MLRRYIRSLIDIVYPPACLLCKKNLKNTSTVENLVCIECWGKIKKNLPPFCYYCGKHLERHDLFKNICSACRKKQLHFDRAFSACAYEGTVKELIHQFKYKNKDYLGFILSRLMIEFIKEYSLPLDLIDFIIPVPLHKARLREREFNQAQVLGDYIAGEFNKKILGNALGRLRYTRSQTELEESARFLNVKNSFAFLGKEDIKGKNILLVDDVLTTGATSSEAASALKRAGAGVIFVLTLAN